MGFISFLCVPPPKFTADSRYPNDLTSGLLSFLQGKQLCNFINGWAFSERGRSWRFGGWRGDLAFYGRLGI